MLKRCSIALLLIVSFGCIDPYTADIKQGPQLLTVEGTITSAGGEQVVRLTRTDTYGSVFEGLIRPETGATVVVRDELGLVTILEENIEEKGNYYTPESFAPTIGRSYTLQIQLSDGKVYSSFPEQMQAAPAIKSLSTRVVQIPGEGEFDASSGVQVIAEVDDPADQTNFYYYRNRPSVYVLETRPDLFTPRLTQSNTSREPQPKDCCNICYRSELVGNKSLFLAQDETFNGLTTRIPVTFIKDDGLRFIDTYRLDVSQLRVSAEAFRFLSLVKQQNEISGSVFDPPPANIRGNMISLGDPDEVVLGYFIAAGESSKRLYISNSDLDFVQPKTIVPDDCRLSSNASIDPPADWSPEN